MRSSLPTFGLDAIDRLLATLSNLPIGMHGGALLALLAGLALWLFGAKVLKPMFAILGIAIGSVLGAVALPMMGIMQVGSFPSVYVGLGAGAIAGLVVACLLFRFALIVSSGLVFAAVGILGASIYLNQKSPGLIDPPARLLLGASTDRPESSSADAGTSNDEPAAAGETETGAANRTALGTAAADAIVDAALPKVQEHAAKARAFLDEMGQRGSDAWESIGTRERLLLTGGGIAGAVLGVLFGVSMPKRSGAMVTALFGASVAFVSTVWLAGATDSALSGVLDQPPLTVAVVLAIATAVGMAIQLTVTNKKSGASAKPAGA